MPDKLLNRTAQLLGTTVFLASLLASSATSLDSLGVTLVRQFDPTLKGNSVRVAQVEAPETTNSPLPFQVNPSSVGQNPTFFTYYSSLGTSATFPNAIGAESGHANGVGENFYGTDHGVAPQIAHVDNYEAGYFYSHIIGAASPPAISSRIVNQSFIFPDQDAAVEQDYDDYAASRNTIFVSGAGFNASQVHPPASCFNGIGVGVSDVVAPPFGPTPDGRCKPDITAPGSYSSFSTPYVAGCAAVLLQAATRGDAGPSTGIATNLITIKSLLLNGAIKPGGWTNSSTAPLDARYGAGIVNIFNSWNQLKGGRRQPIETTTVTTGNPHPPGSNINNEPSLLGWDYASLSTTTSQDKINHYYFNLSGTNAYTLTATLAWNRQNGKSAINNLNLYLYNVASGNVVASSVSTVDNVEHLSLPQLPPGRYDLQVFKTSSGQVSSAETYALAFEMFYMKLNIVPTNSSDIAITWPVSPTGFNLQSAASLTPPVSWVPVNAAVVVNTNTSQNTVVLPIGDGNQFLRLQRP